MRQAPGLPEETRRRASQGLLAAYRALSAEVADPEQRQRYIDEAAELVKELAASYTDETIPVDLLYERGVLVQTRGRSIAVELTRITDPADRAVLIGRSEEAFNEALRLFEQVQQRVKAREDELKPNAERNVKELDELGALRTKAALQLCWTLRYKALLYKEGEPQRAERMKRAIKVLGAFIDQYSSDLSVLSALYGRGLCYRDTGQIEEALADFQQVIGIEEPLPEVARLRAESVCLASTTALYRRRTAAASCRKSNPYCFWNSSAAWLSSL
jgi:tetratricopeptide (TPR) repeat protein